MIGIRNARSAGTNNEATAINSSATGVATKTVTTAVYPGRIKVNTALGGKILYWFDTDGHNCEILTVSYAWPRTGEDVAT